MATTKIWPVKDSLARVVDYAQNPDKTIYSDLQTVLHYAANEEKTVEGEERAMFVTGVNCNRDTAFQEMQAVKERFGKTGGNVAYHAYQSFKPGEVTPELCHRLGVELAKRMWGDEYQVSLIIFVSYVNHLNQPVNTPIKLLIPRIREIPKMASGSRFLWNSGTPYIPPCWSI